jgi:serine/threonine-protein kinase
VREHGPLPWAAAHPILVQIAEGLQFAHARGVVHRDLKPANVMVAGELDDPQCTIIDFGLARREVITSGSESLSRTGEVFGSPPFMSPEQFRGEDVDARTDIYSFGCLMYFVLTGRRPFEGEKIGELMYKHLFETASAPTGLNCPKRLAPALSSITLRALRKAADDRFATAADLLDALQRVPTDPTPVEVPADPEIVGSTTVGTPPPPRPRWPWVLVGAAVVVGALATVRGLDDDSRSPTKVERVVPAPAPDPRSTEATAPTPTAPAPEAVVADDPVRAAAASSSDTSGEGDPAAADATGAVPAPRPRRAKRPTKPAPSTPATTPATKAGSELPPNPFRSTADAPSP